MKILEVKVYRGPNLYEYRPMIRMEVDLEEMEDYPTDKMPGFSDRLMALMPTLADHHCSYGAPGGFVRRMNEGTWMGHVIEHVAIELQSLSGTKVNRGKTRGTGEHGHYYVIYEHKEEEVARVAGYFAFDVVRSLLPSDLPSAMSAEEKGGFNYQARLEDLIRLAEGKALGPSTASLVAAAEERGIPWIRLNERSLVQFGQGKYQKRLEATVTSLTSHIGVEIAQDKDMTLRLLRDAGLPVPRNYVVETEDEAVICAERLGYPVVTKPYNGNHGRAVRLNLMNDVGVREGFHLAYAESDYVIVEKYLTGRDFRILVINGAVVAVAERVPGHIVGDGVHTIKELVDIVNSDPRRGIGHEKILTRIEIDEQANGLIKRAGHTLETVLPAGEKFFLRLTGNLSTGGTAIDQTDAIHYENIQVAQRAIQVIGLDIGGVDFITPDIAKPVSEVGGGIVEINAAPGFRMHIAPSEGQARDVAGKAIEMLFPPGTPTRIPLAAITGTNGKTTTTRMVGHIMKLANYTVGMTTTDGIYLDGERILKGDMTGPWSARVVLRDPRVDCAVLETARGGIVREGLGWDHCTVGAIVNVQGDHLGIGGIDTLEDLAFVKRLVIECVASSGYAVLNADDPMTREMAGHTAGKLFWFTMNPGNEVVREHVRKGGRAAVLEAGANGEMLTLYDDGKHIPLLWAHLIPATHEAHARFNITNALAASAIAYGLGANIETIRLGLRTFVMSFYQAPGRMNIFDEYPFRVIMDYAHNPPAIAAIHEFVRSLPVKGRRIGVVSAPGDRRDVDNIRFAKICAEAFDTLIIKEDWDLRKRAPGEVAGLLYETVLGAGKSREMMEVITNEFDAIRKALDIANAGDLLVVLADDVTGSWKLITKYRHADQYRRWLEETGQPAPPADQRIGWQDRDEIGTVERSEMERSPIGGEDRDD